jgi:RimJ/RimL family protein N-acetyltransferase
MSLLFYYWDQNTLEARQLTLDAVYSWTLWTPRRYEVIPRGLPWMPFAIWWVMHHLRIFSNRDYGIFCVYAGGELVHRSVVSPRYFRFPFMAKDDLQIGDTWTHPAHRRRGIAAFAIQEILAACARPRRAVWYLTEADNIASIRAAEKLGFVKVGEGTRQSRWGLRLLGYFALQQLPEGG